MVFAAKYRGMIYRWVKENIGDIQRELCDQKGIEIAGTRTCPDHIHILIDIPPKYDVSQIKGYPKGKSHLIIFDRHENLKDKYGGLAFLIKEILYRYSGLEQKSRSKSASGAIWKETRLQTRSA